MNSPPILRLEDAGGEGIMGREREERTGAIERVKRSRNGFEIVSEALWRCQPW